MEIKMTKEESEEYFYNSLCNGLGQMSGYGLEFDYKDLDYAKAKKSLQGKIVSGKSTLENSRSICFEDVLMEILRMGNKLSFKDIEGEGEYDRSITLEDVHNRVEKTPATHLMNMVNENDDAETADVILQIVFFEEIVFG